MRVDLQNQTSYESAIDKYIQSSQDSRPTLIQFPEYTLQAFAESDTLIPSRRASSRAATTRTAFVQRTLDAYTFEGIQWSMPFNVSNPVLFYNRKMFEAAGLDPDGPPDHARRTAGYVAGDRRQRCGVVRLGGRHRVRTPAAAGSSSSGSVVPASCTPTTATVGSPRRPRCCTTARRGVELLTFVQSMINDGLAVNVGDNPAAQTHSSS